MVIKLSGTVIKTVVYSRKLKSFLVFMGSFGQPSNSWSMSPINAIAFDPLTDTLTKSVRDLDSVFVKVIIKWEIPESECQS